jgi:hypothetical protein
MTLFFYWWEQVTAVTAAKFLDIDSHSAQRWYMIFGMMAMNAIMCSNTQIGGVGKIVEIDEALFRRMKYKKGKPKKQLWVIGGVERNSSGDMKKMFLQVVNNRQTNSLLDVIRQFVLPNTKIITDGWKGYDGLKSVNNYSHEVVNHSIEFKNEDGYHTNNIEGMWMYVRRFIGNHGCRGELLGIHIWEYMYRRNVVHNNIQRILLDLGMFDLSAFYKMILMIGDMKKKERKLLVEEVEVTNNYKQIKKIMGKEGVERIDFDNILWELYSDLEREESFKNIEEENDIESDSEKEVYINEKENELIKEDKTMIKKKRGRPMGSLLKKRKKSLLLKRYKRTKEDDECSPTSSQTSSISTSDEETSFKFNAEEASDLDEEESKEMYFNERNRKISKIYQRNKYIRNIKNSDIRDVKEREKNEDNFNVVRENYYKKIEEKKECIEKKRKEILDIVKKGIEERGNEEIFHSHIKKHKPKKYNDYYIEIGNDEINESEEK